MFRVNAKYNPPPAGMPSPAMWGDEAVVRERMAPYAREFRFSRHQHVFRALTAEDWIAFMREYFGPMRVAWEKLDDGQRQGMTRDLLALLAEVNQSGDQTLFVPSEYLISVVELK